MRKTRPIYFALVLFGLTLVSQMFHGYNYSYYVEGQSLITMAQASIAKIIFILFDGANDIFFGYLSEKTNFRLGKRKSWIVMAMPLFCMMLILTYIVDNSTPFSNLQFFLYYIFITITFDNVSSILYVNYNSLFPIVFSEENERAKTSSLMRIFEVAGIGVWALGTSMLIKYVGYVYTSVIISAVFLIILTICMFKIHEPKASTEINKFSFKKLIKEVFNNKKFLYFNLAAASFLAILSTFVTILPFVTKYLLHINEVQTMILFGTMFTAAIVSIRFWTMLIKKKGHRYTYKIAFNCFPLGILLIGLSFNFISALILCTIGFSLLGGVLITPDLVMASLIDKDRKENNEQREAGILAVSSFSKRLALLIVVGVIMIVSGAFGYVNGQNPGPNPDLAFRVIASVCLPLIAFLGSVFAHLFLKTTSDDN